MDAQSFFDCPQSVEFIFADLGGNAAGRDQKHHQGYRHYFAEHVAPLVRLLFKSNEKLRDTQDAGRLRRLQGEDFLIKINGWGLSGEENL